MTLISDFYKRPIVFPRRIIRQVRRVIYKETLSPTPLIELSIPKQQTFFGYYDKTPFSLDNSKILGLIAPLHDQNPSSSNNVTIGYFCSHNNYSFHEIAKTPTWCWQQGCRLQWFPGHENEWIIYNTLIDDKYGSVIQDITTKKIIKEIPHPIYDIDMSGNWALSLNFSRLQRLRPGYGYLNLLDETRDDACPGNDGLWLINLNSKKAKLIFSLELLAELSASKSMDGVEHYLNHLSFNPSGTRFLFFHLWAGKGKRVSRLFTCDIDGKNLHLLADEGMVSHYSWKNDYELLVFSYHKSTGKKYHLYRDMSDYHEVFGQGFLIEDGHPSFNPLIDCLLTDTYPDKFSDRKILIWNGIDRLDTVGSFFSPPSFSGEVRCDLHPRWDRTGTKICFDSAHKGFRNMYIMDI